MCRNNDDHHSPSRRVTGRASCCPECRSACVRAVAHRDDTPATGGPAADIAPENTAAAAPPTSWLRERPWVWIWIAFLVLISAWTVFILVSLRYQPASIPLPPRG